TLPTDGIAILRDRLEEAEGLGVALLAARQAELGTKIRALLGDRGFRSVAAEGFQASSVVVCHTEDEAIHRGAKFAEAGVQIAAGVPLMCGEPKEFRSFRVGLFGM